MLRKIYKNYTNGEEDLEQIIFDYGDKCGLWLYVGKWIDETEVNYTSEDAKSDLDGGFIFEIPFDGIPVELRNKALTPADALSWRKYNER
jgi:hypothetical protein